MSGTKQSGKLAAATNKKKYGKDYYKRIGAIGGKAEKTKPSGMAYMAIHYPKQHKEVSALGGRISRRKKRVVNEEALAV